MREQNKCQKDEWKLVCEVCMRVFMWAVEVLFVNVSYNSYEVEESKVVLSRKYVVRVDFWLFIKYKSFFQEALRSLRGAGIIIFFTYCFIFIYLHTSVFRSVKKSNFLNRCTCHQGLECWRSSPVLWSEKHFHSLVWIIFVSFSFVSTSQWNVYEKVFSRFYQNERCKNFIYTRN